MATLLSILKWAKEESDYYLMVFAVICLIIIMFPAIGDWKFRMHSRGRAKGVSIRSRPSRVEYC